MNQVAALLDLFFITDSDSLLVLYGNYNYPLVGLSIFVAILAGVMALQLAGIARTETRANTRQTALISGAFVLGSGVWSMHFIGMLAFSICSTAKYDPVITLASMLPSFLASWVALILLARERITHWQLVISGISVGAGIGIMHYAGMEAVHSTLSLRFEPWVFALSVVVAVVLSIAALWLRFGLTARSRFSQRQINLLAGVVLGCAISGMHYTGMQAARFLVSSEPGSVPEENIYLALSIAGTAILAILITGGINVLLRYRAIYLRVQQNEARVRTIVGTAVDGIITIDSNGNLRDFNASAESIFGWHADEVIGRNIRMLIPTAEHGEPESYLLEYMQDSSSSLGASREIYGLRKNGDTFPLRLAIGRAVLPNETLFVGFVTDISDRKQMEEALRHSEQQYRSLIGNLPGVAFRCRLDSDWSMLFISDAVERLTGWPPETFLRGDKSFTSLIHPEDRGGINEIVTEALYAQRAYMIEYRIIDRNGVEHWVSESASGVLDADGKVEWIDGVIIDITDSKRRNAEFEGVANAISRSSGVIEFDLSGTILTANENFLNLTGYTLAELQGKHHSMLCLPVDVLAPEYRDLWSTLRQGRHTSGEFHRIGKHGQDIWIHGSYNPIFDPDGRPYKVIKIATDLTERHAMEDDLRIAKAKAEQAAAAKSTFLANMSHEIRTPMNAIIGFTEVLLGEDVTDSQRRHLGTVRNSARSLLVLLNDILDTAKLERGAVELEIRDFSLRDVCMQVLASLRVNAQAKHLPLILNYADAEPEFFKGDGLRIQQILLNLVGNAIKFTEKGQVEVRVTHADGKVHLTVSDTGIGIRADRLARIFDPFAQADASMTRRFGGTGLGTTIARQLVELMEGRIWVESEPGVGSRFHVELPLPLGEAVEAGQEQAPIALPPLDILVADDVPQNLELLQLMLTRLGHRLVTAGNGADALAAFQDGRFDVVLMDVQMPVMNGLDASGKIRAFEAAQQRAPTPIIALTASVLEEDIAATREAGMDGFASKPVDFYRLTREIARLLKLQTSDETPQAIRSGVNVRGSVIDWTQGQRLWGSEEKHRAAIRKFLGDFASVVPDLRQISRDRQALREQAHRLKGAAANLALTRVAHLAGSIEDEQDSDSHISTLIDRLADELQNVIDTLGHLPEPGTGNTTAALLLSPAELRSLLQRIDAALQHGELPDTDLAQLAGALPQSVLGPLDEAINSFDFDAARRALAGLAATLPQENTA